VNGGEADLVALGRAALASGAWPSARSHFQAALKREESAEAMDGLAQACFWLGQYDDAIKLREQGYAAFQRRGDRARAAESARWVAFIQLVCFGNFAVAGGWLARAERLLTNLGDCSERGWLALLRVMLAPHPDEKKRAAAEALELGRRLDNPDLEFNALSVIGEMRVSAGRIQAGMSDLDEAMAAVAGGDVRDFAAVGDIYCKLLCACEEAGDFKRAAQWIAAAVSFADHLDHKGVSAVCRSFYGGLLIMGGRWAEADAELQEALRLFEAGYGGVRFIALIRLAELRVCQGRLEEAKQLLIGLEDLPHALATRAALHLAQGELDTAKMLAERFLGTLSEPGVLAAPVIALQVQIGLARGDLETAQSVAARLIEVASAGGNDCCRGHAELAMGRVCRATGDPRAVRHLEAALGAFGRAEMPFEQARARLELARALSQTNPEGAISEARRALAVFERLSASRQADAAAQLLRELGASGRARVRGLGTLSGREVDVLKLLGAGLTNQQIAGRLYLSRRTVEHHVSNILSKLGLATRAEVAAYAVRNLVESSAAVKG